MTALWWLENERELARKRGDREAFDLLTEQVIRWHKEEIGDMQDADEREGREIANLKARVQELEYEAENDKDDHKHANEALEAMEKSYDELVGEYDDLCAYVKELEKELE